MGFRKLIKKRGIKVGNYVTFGKGGMANVSNIKNIGKYRSVEFYIDDSTMEIGLLFSEKDRLKFEDETFAIIKNCKSYYIDAKPLFIDLGIKLGKRIILPFRSTDEKMYVFDFSKIKED